MALLYRQTYLLDHSFNWQQTTQITMKKPSLEKIQLMQHPWLYSRDSQMDQNHPQSYWQTTI